jgi:hypothetical protein
MLLVHLCATFVLFKESMLFNVAISRAPRLLLSLYIVVMIRKSDAGTQGKWHVWENKSRLVTVILHCLLAICI